MRRALEQERLAQKSRIQRHGGLLKSDVQEHKKVNSESEAVLCSVYVTHILSHIYMSVCQSDGTQAETNRASCQEQHLHEET